MQNTLFYAEREYQSRARLGARAVGRELVLQSRPALSLTLSGVASQVTAGAHWLESLRQAASRAVRWSSELRRSQEQCCTA